MKLWLEYWVVYMYTSSCKMYVGVTIDDYECSETFLVARSLWEVSGRTGRQTTAPWSHEWGSCKDPRQVETVWHWTAVNHQWTRWFLSSQSRKYVAVFLFRVHTLAEENESWALQLADGGGVLEGTGCWGAQTGSGFEEEIDKDMLICS